MKLRTAALVSALLSTSPAYAASLGGPLISHVTSDKAFYAAGATASIKVALTNSTGSAFNGRIKLAVCSRGNYAGFQYQDTTLAAGASQTLTFSQAVPTLNTKGYQLVVIALAAANNSTPIQCYGSGTGNSSQIDTATGAINVAANAWEDPIEAFVDAPTLASSTVTAQQVADNLAQYHVSLVQGYDLLWRHDEPMPTAPSWKNLAGVTVAKATVGAYKAALNGYGAKFLAYSLWNGAWSDYQTANPNVQLSMGMFSSPCGASGGTCALGSQGSTGVGAGWPSWGWQSDGLYYMSPNNGAWTSWIAGQLVSALTLGFDGVHLDTLGDDGNTYYDFAGRLIPNIGGSISNFSNYMQDRLGVCTDINQVSAQNIQDVAVRSRECNHYVEPHPELGNYAQYFSAMYMVRQFREWSSRPIIQAYYPQQVASGVLPLSNAVNVGSVQVCDPSLKGSAACPANDPGIELMLGQIALAGASPLIVGDYDHIIPGPFFPRASLGIDGNLQQYLADYWNWYVGQRDVLRDGIASDTGLVAYLTDGSGNSIGSSTGAAGAIFTRTWGKAGVAAGLSLTNLVGLSDNRIDDPDGLHKPIEQLNVNASLSYFGSGTPGTLWYSAPDINHGIPQKITYTNDSTNKKVTFVVPDLKTVGQLVLEGGNLETAASDYTVDSSDFIRGTTASKTVNGMGYLSGALVHGCCRRWARWDVIDLGTSGVSTVQASVSSATGGQIEFHADAPDGPLIGTIYASAGDNNAIRSATANSSITGVHKVYLVFPRRDVSVTWWKP